MTDDNDDDDDDVDDEDDDDDDDYGDDGLIFFLPSCYRITTIPEGNPVTGRSPPLPLATGVVYLFGRQEEGKRRR